MNHSRVNIGCGQTPTEGWHYYDSSLSLRLANRTSLTRLLDMLGLLKLEQLAFIEYAVNANIRFSDATKHIPEPSGSVEVLYSSHMLVS